MTIVNYDTPSFFYCPTQHTDESAAPPMHFRDDFLGGFKEKA